MHEHKIKRVWIQWGWMKAFSVGIHLSTIQCSLDLIIFYIQVEFPISKRRLRKMARNG